MQRRHVVVPRFLLINTGDPRHPIAVGNGVQIHLKGVRLRDILIDVWLTGNDDDPGRLVPRGKTFLCDFLVKVWSVMSNNRSRSRSPPRKRSITPRKYSKSPQRRSRSISQHNSRQHRNQRRDYRESSGVRKDIDRTKSPLSRTKHKERHKSKTKDIKKKSRSRTPNTRPVSKTSKQGDRPRRKSRERCVDRI